MEFAMVTHFSTNCLQIDLWTYVLDPAMQLCPQLENRMQACLAASSRSESGKMILADFPPSSSVIGFKLCLCELRMMRYPTSVEPVKDILLTSRCCDKCSPVLPKPVMILITPAGKPAFTKSYPNRRAVIGVCSAGLRTTVHPAAKAGATFQAIISSGQFQGMICATTPIGSFFVQPRKGGLIASVLPFILSVWPAKQRQTQAVQGISSFLEMLQGLPLLRVSKQARESAFYSIRSASLQSSRPRECGSKFLHSFDLKALEADQTARSTSSLVAAIPSEMADSVLGLMMLKGFPSFEFMYSPLMNNFLWTNANLSWNFMISMYVNYAIMSDLSTLKIRNHVLIF